VNLNQKLSGLTETRRKLFLKRLNGIGQKTKEIEIPPVYSNGERELSDIPLSYAQQRIWMIQQMDPLNPWFNTYAMFDIQGAISEEIMQKSFKVIMNRHVILNVAYKLVDDDIKQYVREISKDDYLEMVQGINPDELYYFAKAEVSKPFNLEVGPLARFILIKLSDDHYSLVLVMHHIVSDGWSVGVLFRELIEYYDSFLNESTIKLPPLDIQYPDYANWQRQLMQEEKVAADLIFWKEKLDGVPPLLQVPSDYKRPPIQQYLGRSVTIYIEDDVVAQLRSIGSKQGASLYIVLVAAFKVMLHRYSGENDIVIGTSVANRNRKELEELIGCFINTVVLRTMLDSNANFLETLESVKSTVLEAFNHKEYPFEKIVEVISPKRDLSYTPIFQVMFILNESSISNKRMQIMDSKSQKTKLKFTSLELDNGTSKYDLTINIEKRMDRWTCRLEYSTELFSNETADRMLQNFKVLLNEINANPYSPIRELPIMTEQEMIKVTSEWNNTHCEVPYQTIHQLFDEQAESNPESIAVMYQDKQITYEELRNQANRLSLYFTTIGIQRGSKVGIYMESSIDLIISLLAVFKAGAAYVPLDPKYPLDRNNYVLENSNASIILTDNVHCEDQLLVALSIPVFTVGMKAIYDIDEKRFERARPDDLAYILYTSGSTGKPKGVKVTHQSVVNLILSFKNNPGISSNDVFASVTSISFDISVLEFFLPLVSGAKLVLVPYHILMNGTALKGYLEEIRATIMQATPSIWRLLLDSGWNNNEHLKVFCGGEALTTDLARSLLNKGSELWNLYGPTETTVWSTIAKIETVDQPIKIGRPISNTRIYILDSQGQPVPIGVAGEIHIGGMGVSEGYLDLPFQTQERFIRSLFRYDFNTLLYKTGDLGRYLSDGNIEHLGRLDSQTKLRGHRVELGNIEAALNEIDAIKQSSVLITNINDDSKIIAYVVWHENQISSGEYVKKQLKSRLPEYMIPSFIVDTQEIPLLPNGKVNKKLLPAFDLDNFVRSNIYEEPRTITEKRLSKIWSKVLAIENVGVNDSFFDLGGHSLLAIKLVSQINEEFQVDIPVISLFTNEESLRDLALRIDSQEESHSSRVGGGILVNEIAELLELLDEN
jgi:amino acid adenylation domain-containing protein